MKSNRDARSMRSARPAGSASSRRCGTRASPRQKNQFRLITPKCAANRDPDTPTEGRKPDDRFIGLVRQVVDREAEPDSLVELMVQREVDTVIAR